MSYCDQLKDRMQEQGIPQRYLAYALGITEKTMNAKLNERSDFKVHELLTVCDVLHVSPNHLDFE